MRVIDPQCSLNELSSHTLGSYVRTARQYTPTNLHQASNRIRGITTAIEKKAHIDLLTVLATVGDPRIQQESVVSEVLRMLLESPVY